MYNGRTTLTRRGGTRCLQDDNMDEGDTDHHNGRYDEGGLLREATPPPRFTRGIRKLQGETLREITLQYLNVSSLATSQDLQVLHRKTSFKLSG